MQVWRGFRRKPLREAEILVNGAARLLQFKSVSGWITLLAGPVYFLFRLMGGGGP
jgi:hypothetical protein